MTKKITILKTVLFSLLLVSFIGISNAQSKSGNTAKTATPTQAVDNGTQQQGAFPQDSAPIDEAQPANSLGTAQQQELIQKTYEGVIVGVTEQDLPSNPQDATAPTAQKEYIQKLKIKLTNGDMKAQTIDSTNNVSPQANTPVFKVGDRVTVLLSSDALGQKNYYVTDYFRRDTIYFLIGITAIIAILFLKWKGVSYFASIAYTLAIVFKILLPRLLAGANPVLITVLCAVLIAPVLFYLSYGFNKKASIALASTLTAIFVTGIIAITFMKMAIITGYASQEALFIQITTGMSMNMRGLFLCGILIGILGVLEDLTTHQVDLVEKIKSTNKKKDITEIFFEAMKQGQSHAGALIKTTTFMFIGFSLPLLILFLKTAVPAIEILNSEIIVNDIVRTVTFAVSLLLCIPITTILAVQFLKEDEKSKVE